MKITAFTHLRFLPILGLSLMILVIGCKDDKSSGNENITEDEEVNLAAKNEAEENTLEDGGEPWVLDIEEATVKNNHYRIEQWTGKHLQMVLMSVKPGEEIPLEVHEANDQFYRIEQGEAQVLMGKSKDNLSFDETVSDDWSIFIPAGYYHNIKNTGEEDLKVYTIYAPKQHEKGTLHETYEEAREAHDEEH